MSLHDDIQKDAEQYGAQSSESSDFFKFEKGVNKIRILNKPTILAMHFFGKGEKAVVCIGIQEGCPHHKEDDQKASIKLVTYVIDRNDGKIKLAELPLSIGYTLNNYMEDEDYAFDEFPAPYDVKITHDPDNSDPKSKYVLIPSPNKTELTEEERKEFDEIMGKMTPEQYVEKRKDKFRAPKETTYPERMDPDDIPFD